MKVTRFVPLFVAWFAAPACSKTPAAATDAGSSTEQATASQPDPRVTTAGPSAALPTDSSNATGEEALEGEDLDGMDGLDSDEGRPDEDEDEDGEPEGASGVAIKNVGMRFGGGPNDAASKEPTRKAIMAQFDEFRLCHAKVAGKRRFGTYGVDIRIGRGGGRASIGKPRTDLKGAEFRDCMKKVLEAIEFPKPPGNRPASLSYSIRFEQAKGE